MIYQQTPHAPSPLRRAVQTDYLADEAALVETLIKEARVDEAQRERIKTRAGVLIGNVREGARRRGGLDAFMHEYDLNSQEGVILMCLAEALLRIPDAATADRLIQDKLTQADWEVHLGRSTSPFVNAATWGLMLTGRVVKLEKHIEGGLNQTLKRLVSRSGEPVIRLAMKEAMRIMGRQFVMGRTLPEALARREKAAKPAYRYSFDMLGEAALCAADAERYFQAYAAAIDTLAGEVAGENVFAAPGVSIKLSALHPRFEFAQGERLQRELVPRVLDLALRAKTAGIGLTLDAEEAERLEPCLDVFEAVYLNPDLHDWPGFGLAVQTYQKRAPALLDYLEDLAHRGRRRIPLRLVKGAYWDSEIKRAQERGLAGYPVFTRKLASDTAFIACARRLLNAPAAFYAQFATHNAYAVASVLEFAGASRDFEFQRLHGMGEDLYAGLMHEEGVACRVYAPVGSHEDLLPYLVRRLLENGANTSFVNRIVDEQTPIEELLVDPAEALDTLAIKPHPRIPLPENLFGTQRLNSQGLNLHDAAELKPLSRELSVASGRDVQASALVAGEMIEGPGTHITNPADRRQVVGHVQSATPEALERALQSAHAAAPEWSATPAAQRAGALTKAAKLFEQHRPELLSLLMREAGRCLNDAVSELREAVDYCRYYGALAREHHTAPQPLPGPTGEDNRLGLHGRGVFACISPWNFPLAIFTGQLTAALAAGNAVIAKPASQTPLIAMRAVQLLHEAGIPVEALHLVPGSGAAIGQPLIDDRRIAGVVFTGSTETAAGINRTLAARPGPITPFIAETGGQNAMIVDSSALPEQVVIDVLQSAFNSAGQRCSALRVLFLQEEIAPRVIQLLCGAMDELSIGDPGLISTDVGPVIDAKACSTLRAHAEAMRSQGKLLHQITLPPQTEHGDFFAPAAFEIEAMEVLQREVFGPILHIVRYASNRLDAVIEAINQSGYGLTLGIHSRIEERARHIIARARVGNIYVNRNMIGAVVGVQPFGGEGLSGTGPKAGGPHYLKAMSLERTVCTNTSAMGGNASLLGLEED